MIGRLIERNDRTLTTLKLHRCLYNIINEQARIERNIRGSLFCNLVETEMKVTM